MPDGNPLVAAPQETTTAVTGIGILESAQDIATGVSDGSWVEAGLGILGAGLEVLSMVIDPLGTLASYGVSWLIEHVRPLKEALDWFAGDPPVIQSFSDTWANVANAVGAVSQDYVSQANGDTSGWTGTAGAAYRTHAAETADAVAGAGALASGISAGVMVMGEVVAFVREFVRDMVGELVGRLISWALETVATLGLATPVVVAQATAAISRVVNKVSDLCRKLVKTIANVAPRLRAVIGKLDEIIEKLARLTRRGNSPDAPTTPASATRTADAPTTHTAGGTTPSGTTTPSGAHTDTPTTHGNSGGSTGSGTTGDGTSPSSTTTGSDKTGTTPSSTKDGTTSGSTTDADARRTSQDDRSTCTNGDPINVYTGEVLLPQTDVELAGVLPLVIRRRHASNYRLGRLFGPSWASTVDQRLEIGDDRIRMITEDGRLLVFPIPGDTPVEPVEGPRWTLDRAEAGYRVNQPESGLTLWFGAGADAAVAPLSAVVSRYRHRIDLRYAEDGTLVEVSHSGGYRVAVDTDDGLVSGLRLLGNPQQPDVPLMRYTYRDRRLVEVVNSSGRPQKFDYDTDGRITRWEDRNGEWYKFHFDRLGRCYRTEGSGDALAGTLEIDSGTRTSVWTDSLGARTTYHFNELNQVVREVDALGHAVESEWDRYDRLLARTDQLGRTTRYVYDDAGRLAAVTNAGGGVRRFQFDDLGMPVSITDPDGSASLREYDATGNLITATDAMGAVTRYEYDERGALTGVVDPVGGRYAIVTDATGLPVALTDPRGATIRYDRDQFGRITAITDPLGATTRYGWTVEGLPLYRVRPGERTERWLHDGEGNHTEHIDALGQHTRIESTHFDLPAAVTGPDGSRLEYTYDSQLRLVAVTNAQGAVWRYEHDAVGNLIAETDFSGRRLAYEYDAAGQVVARVNAEGQTTRLVWDAVGNLVERRSDDGTFATFAYDAAGRIVRAVNADADVEITYDAAGRALSESTDGRVLTTGYDPMGRLVSRRTPTGASSTWDYDAASNPVALHTPGATITFGYDLAGREVRRGIGGATVLAQTWDPAARLVEQTVNTSRGPGHRRAFTYRPDDNVIAIDDTLSGLRRFDLDFAGRVRSVTGPAGAENYTYDRAGNIVSDDRERHTFDRHGRLIVRQRRRLSAKPASWRYDWNAEDRLVGVSTPDGVRWRYRYDALGRRIAKERLAEDGSVAESWNFTWDGTVLAEQVHSGGRAVTWDWSPDGVRPVSQVERVLRAPQEWVDQEFYGIVTDLVGTPTELLDASGEPVWRAARSVWGEDLAAVSGRAYTPLRFPGQYHDPESGLNYNYHRYYLPSAGRYASADPLGLLPSPNPYAYVPNPGTWLDPLGLAPCRDCTARSGDLPKGDNRWYDNRREAFNAARERAGIPRSQQPVRQWTVGDDVTRRGLDNYVYDPNRGAHGRYYHYDTPNGPRVVAEHTADPRAPHPHFHAYQPKEGASGIVPGEKYARVGEPHHFYHSGHDPNWTP